MIDVSEPQDRQQGRAAHADATADTPAAAHSLRQALSVRDFRLLLGGAATSLLGDQFALIATPWLVLHLTDDPLALGIVLALEGVPRALFMLVGGVVTDRFAPRRVLLAADVVRAVLVGAMAVVVLAGAVEMWMLYAFGLGFGLVAGFAVPAENSVVPTLLGRDELQAGNALMMGIGQLAGFVGPSLAGAVIATVTSAAAGVGLAYVVDAVTFAVSATAFALMHRTAVSEGTQFPGVMAALVEGIVFIAGDAAMRFVFFTLAAVNLFAVGPLLVGMPLLAHDRLAGGAAALGVLMASFAVGNVVGLGIAGATRTPSSRTMRVILLGFLGGFGGGVMLLASGAPLAPDAGLLATLGAGNGYLAVLLFTWVQTRTAPELLGRTVSFVTFASLGLVSVSQVIAGVVARWDLDALFLLSGACVVATAGWTACRPGLRAFTHSLGHTTHLDVPIPTTHPTHEKEERP